METGMSIIDDAKQIADLIKKYNDQDLYERIVTLRGEILALREENLTLKEDLRQCREAAAMADRLVRHGNCYFLKDDGKLEKPYCLTCWDSDKKLVSLIVGGGGKFPKTVKCGICAARKK
jgi:hypothetical protein